MKVTIFTTFGDSDPAYSLNNVVVDQIKMFEGQSDYELEVLVKEGFKAEGTAYAAVTLKYLPHVHLSNEGKLPTDYENDVEKVYQVLKESLANTNVVITHDIIYQPAHLIHNVACRRLAAERPELRWLHWIHSATSPSVLCNQPAVKAIITQAFPNSLVCYPNSYERVRVSTNFKYEERDVKHVPHPIDIPKYLGFTELATEFTKKYGLIESDVNIIYPVRLDRGKQVEKVVAIAAGIKRQGRSVRCVIVDFHSTGGDKLVYRDLIKAKAVSLDLSDLEVIFTSDYSEETKYRCPREFVRDLFLISNVFILPSVSETYSLVAQEAAICGNLLVLNFDFPPMRSIYGDMPYYYKFSSNMDALTGMDGETTTRHTNDEVYYNQCANGILFEIENNRVIAVKDMLRKTRNSQYVFRKHLEPLLHASEQIGRKIQ